MQKRLNWSKRALSDADKVYEYYTAIASLGVAGMARVAITEAVFKLATLPALHRAGKGDTREYVMDRFPYTIIYRATEHEIRIVRILHQARSYFNE